MTLQYSSDEEAARGGYPVEAVGSNAAIDRQNNVANLDHIGPFGVKNLEVGQALSYKHPDYLDYVQKWAKYSNCYEANDIYRYIHRHLRESDVMFEQRVKRGYYYNYVSAIVDLFISYLFHSPIVRDFGKSPDLFNYLMDDCDLAGTSYSDFMVLAATQAQINGHVGILVDAPKVTTPFQNEADRKAAKHRPYLSLIHATQIQDWELDRFGNFEWIKIEFKKPQERTFTQTVEEDVRYFLIWSKTEWQEWRVEDENPILLDKGTHDLGCVPIVIMRNERLPRHPWFGLSAIRDISDINIAILNWASMGDEEIFERCLNILTMERDEGDAAAEMSHHNVLEYASGSHPPAYLIPGTTPLDMVGAWIDRAKDEIYRIAKLGGSVGLQGTRSAASGIAYAFEFNETNQSLSKKAASTEHAEQQIMKLISLWQNSKEFDGRITYPREFGVEDYLSDLNILMAGRNTLTSETAIKELEKKVTNKIFSLEDPELRQKIAKEIDSQKDIPPLTMPNQMPDEMFGTRHSQAGKDQKQIDGKQVPPAGGSSGDSKAASGSTEGQKDK